MLKSMLCATVLVTSIACSGSTADPLNTLVLLDSTGQTASFGAVTMTATSTSEIVSTPGGTLNGVVVKLTIAKSPPDTTKPLVSCIDVRLYTQASGGTMIYSANDAGGIPCHAATGITTGPSGLTEGLSQTTAVRYSDVASALARGTYYARFHVTFPDSSVGEVRAATFTRF